MQLDANFQFINEEFYADRVTPPQYDLLLADGWRHFGEHFFRYNLGIYEDEIRLVEPLRIVLDDFHPSKSQRRNLNRNQDASTRIRPIKITPDIERLFYRHRVRFKSGAPDSILDFLSLEPASVPTDAFQLEVYLDDVLIAVSFFDIGQTSLSSIYAMFDPIHERRGLGIFTMLREIEHARQLGLRYYYHGYAYDGRSFYDYKKRFSALEQFDWRGRWRPYTH